MSWSKVIASLCMFKERRKILTKFRNEFDVESSSLLDGDENFVNLDGLISSVRPINVADMPAPVNKKTVKSASQEPSLLITTHTIGGFIDD